MPQLFSNNASSVLAAALTSSATSLTLAPGSGAKFPSPGGGNYFVLTLYQMSGSIEINHEIARCTARAGDVLTIVRGQEGTTARAFNLADPVSMRLTAGALTPAALGAMDATASLGGVVLLATLTPSVAANLNFLTVFNSAYDHYFISANGINSAGTGNINLRFAVDGVVDVASNYVNVVAGIGVSTTDVRIPVLDVSNIGRGGCFSIHIQNVNEPALLKFVSCNGAGNVNNGTVYLQSTNSGVYIANNKVSGFQLFFFNGVNFGASGIIRVYGYKNT